MIREKLLAEAVGVPRALLKEARAEGSLREGEHWERLPAGITYTDAGEAALRAWVVSRKFSSGSESSELAGAIGEAGDESGAPERVKVRITKIWQGNDRRMGIERDGESGVLQVKTTLNFMVGMEVDALAHEGSRLYHYRGRYPKRKGKL